MWVALKRNGRQRQWQLWKRTGQKYAIKISNNSFVRKVTANHANDFYFCPVLQNYWGKVWRKNHKQFLLKGTVTTFLYTCRCHSVRNYEGLIVNITYSCIKTNNTLLEVKLSFIGTHTHLFFCLDLFYFCLSW